MTRSDFFSSIALGISIISLGLSAYFGLRDRAKIHTSCNYYPLSEHRPASMKVSIVNSGRRPIVLRMICKSDKQGHWVGEYIGDDKKGYQLGEHEGYEIRLTEENLFGTVPEEGDLMEIDDLYFEDFLGKKYPIKNARENLRQYYRYIGNLNNQLNSQTHGGR